MAYKLNLYRGYIAICHPDEQHLNMVGVPEAIIMRFVFIVFCCLEISSHFYELVDV